MTSLPILVAGKSVGSFQVVAQAPISNCSCRVVDHCIFWVIPLSEAPLQIIPYTVLTMTDLNQQLVFRAPSASNAPKNPHFKVPSVDFLNGTWHVTHSSLPMWKSKRNVRITYTPLSDSPEKLDDLVQYQSLTGDKLKSVNGIDTPNKRFPGSYDWRGKGWLKIASSHWEVLGYGAEEGGWAVTYFAKTVFTPAGIDVYSRQKTGFSEELLQKVKSEMQKVEDADFKKLEESLFAIKHD